MTKSAKSQNDCFPDGAVPLESILFTEELHRRPSRPPDYEQENRALVALASTLADSPSTIFQALAETIQDITQCDSAGLSLLTKDGKTPDVCGERFYWPAIAGIWNPHVGGGTPRNFGPCGDVLDQNRTLLFRHFERRYPYLTPVIPAAEECLLVPFYVAGKAVGTIWAIMHSDRRKFDAEDDRVMASLGKYASSAYQAFVSIEDLRLQVAEREKAQTKLRKLSDGLEKQVRSRTDELEQRNKQLAEARARLADEKLRLERSQFCLAEGERLSHTGSWRWDVNSGKVDASQECYAIFGLDPEMDEGSHSLFIDRVHPEDRGDIERVVWSAVHEKRDWEAEFRIVLPGGSIRHLHDIARCRVSQSGGIEYLGIAMDITERSRAEEAVRQSENELRDVIEAIPTSAWTARSDGSVEFVNRHWREYTGLSGEGSFGSGWQAAVHPEDVGRHVDKWRTALATGEQFENEVRYRRSADGKYRWFLARAVPLRDEHGNILKWYGISTDIEDRRQAEGMLAGEKRILEMVAKGDSLAQILDSLCRLVEEQDQDVLASVSLVHGNRLQHGGAPSLPRTFRNAIDGSVIGPHAGSCGTAAFRGEQVIVSDIATDPLWADYRDAALRHSLRACWSTPVFSSEGNVIATFAMYYRESRSPSTRDKEIIEQISHLAGEAIQRRLAEEKLRRSEAYSAEAQRLSHTGSWHWSVSTGDVAWSQEYCAIFGFDFEKDKPSYQLFIERVHPEDRPKVEQVLWADVREKRDFDGEYRLLLPDGSIKYLHSLGKCSLGQSGDVEYIGAVVDITEHKRAEQELRDSEQKHRVVVEAASDAVISMDENSTILFANAATLRIFGHDPIELIGKPLTVLMPEFLRKAHEAGFKNYLATGQRHINWQGTELTGLRKNGQKFPVEISFGELTKDGHRLFTGFIRDISERKRAEDALRRSEAYLAEGQRLCHMGSWHWNVATGELLWSREFCAIFGFDPEETRPSYPSYLERIHPDDRSRVEETRWEAAREQRDFDIQYRLLLPNDVIKYVHSMGRCSADRSGNLEYIGAMIDITERKLAEKALRRSEERWRAVFENSAIGVALTDPEGRFIAANAAYQKMLGYSEEELRSLTFLELTHPDFHESNSKQIQELKDGEKAQFQIEKKYKRKDGSWLWVTNNVSLVPGSETMPQFTMYLSEDITDRKRAEEERERLRQAQADLAHINRVSTMGELTASLAHEIKQPITAAVTDAKACLRWLDRDQPALVKAREAASRLIRDVTRASDIISRIGSLFKKEIVHRELVDVNDVIQEMITLLRSEAARYSITIDSQLSDGLPKITADRVQLQQVLMNLMINGIEAMKDLGSSGALSIRSQEDGNRQVMLSVHDNGTGLTPEQVDQIFNAFFTTKPQGTGLGLAISRSIVESHGGRLWATCDDRPGATFHFTLPIEATAAPGRITEGPGARCIRGSGGGIPADRLESDGRYRERDDGACAGTSEARAVRR